jgi:hypothetical protein
MDIYDQKYVFKQMKNINHIWFSTTSCQLEASQNPLLFLLYTPCNTNVNIISYNIWNMLQGFPKHIRISIYLDVFIVEGQSVLLAVKYLCINSILNISIPGYTSVEELRRRFVFETLAPWNLVWGTD